jgi:hypothetical protein
MRYKYLIIALAAFMSIGYAADGDIEYSNELGPDTYLNHNYRQEAVQRDTTEVIIGVQATGNYIPFWGNSYDACRFMTLYLQSEIGIAGEIVTLSFMPSGSNTGTFDNVRVNLCHTSVTQLSTTFDDNYTGNTPVQVMNEPSLVVGNAGNVWMDWDVSFAYNNTDNLLIEILWNGDNGVGVPIWRTTESVPRRLYAWNDMASVGTVGNQCYYVKLAISTGPPPAHDVGTIAINAPGTMIMPNTTLDPSASYQNFGTNQETFDVYFLIDSAGVNLYNETANITLDAGVDTTISFASWTCGPDGAVYDIIAFTDLPGDTNPANDTLTQVTNVSAAFWEILTPIPAATSGHSESTVHDGTYMVSGFHPSGSYPSTIYHYDIATDSWTMGDANPYGCGAYGMAYGVLGKHYRICGTDGWPTGLTRVDIYDPASGWSAGAAAPMANMDQIGGVYNDSLIFMFGGGNWGGSVVPHTNVYFYDVYEDAWTQATNFTGQGRGCLAGGVVGDYAIVACGYDGGSSYLADYIVGNIDPADPSTITWGAQTTIPGGFEGRYRVCSGVDYPVAPYHQELYVTCGQGNSNPQCSDIWSYEPIADVWTNWNMPKNLAIGNVNSLAITTTALDDIGVYVAGGYTGSYVTDHECFHTGKIGIEEMGGQQTPSAIFGFSAQMKNPTDGYSAITYTTTKPGKVLVKIYDGTGRLIKTLVNRGQEPAGTKTVYWNARDNEARTVANGIYFVMLETEGETATHKLILVK